MQWNLYYCNILTDYNMEMRCAVPKSASSKDQTSSQKSPAPSTEWRRGFPSAAD